MKRFKVIKFSDSPLRWASAMPYWPQGTHYQGAVYDFYSNIERIRQQLTRQITEKRYLPPVLIEHAHVGTVEGHVEDWRILSIEEAGALGIKQQAPMELYLGMVLLEPLATAYDEGRLRGMSPDVRGTLVSEEPWVSEDGDQWDHFIAEFSAASVAHNKRQTPAASLRGIQMADTCKVKMADGSIEEYPVDAALPEGAVVMEDDAEDVDVKVDAGAASPSEDKLDQILKMLTDNSARIAALEAAKMTDPSAAPGAPAATPAQTGTVDSMAMSDRIARKAASAAVDAMRGEQKRQSAAQRVDDVLRTRNVRGLTRDHLLRLCMSDTVAFNALVESSPMRNAASNRTALGGSQGLTPAQALFSDEGVKALRAKHTKAGKFDAEAYKAEWTELRNSVKVSPVSAVQFG